MKMNICLNCKKEFPNRILHSGKIRSVHRRQFCLECVPPGMRNLNVCSICKNVFANRIAINNKIHTTYGRKNCFDCQPLHTKIKKDTHLLQSKICTNCKIDKPLNQFHKRGDRKSITRSHCIECLKINSKQRVNNYRRKNLDTIQNTLPFTTRICSTCKKEKPIEMFVKNICMKYGIGTICRECRAYDQKDKRKSNRYKFLTYKKSATKRGLQFFLTSENFEDIIVKPCFYCGDEKSLGIDRKNNDIGYTIENSLPCCTMCNQLKWNNGFNLFIGHLLKIMNNLKKKGILNEKMFKMPTTNNTQ